MESLSSWWAALTPALKVYWGLAIPFSILFVGQLIISLFGGGDHDDVPDVDVDSDHGIGTQFLTLKNLGGFFTIFSWTGIAGTYVGWSQGFTLTMAILSGIIMVGIMVGVMYLLMKMNANGTMKIAEAVGKSGEVYLSIPARRDNFGKIQIMVGGMLRTLDAVTDDEEAIPTGRHARVASILDNNLLLVTSK
jgi:uncharacterized membrane protein